MVIMTYLEEKNRCKHIWEETERFRGTNMLGTMCSVVHLKCIKCGEVKSKNLD